MTGGSCGIEDPSVRQLMEQLTETVRRIDQDDLNGLAKMHEWCQQLANACLAVPQPAAQAVAGQAASLTGKLEALILGEAEDAAGAFAAIGEGVNGLAAALADGLGGVSMPTEGTSPSPGTGTERVSDAEVEASLAKVFDDPDGQSELLEAAPGGGAAEAVPVAPAGSPATTPEQERYQPSPLTLSTKEFDFLKGFVEEAGEHIQAIEAAVLDVEQAPEDSEKINELFRPFHTIKGLGGFLNLRDINCLTHEVETLLDQGRKGQRAITPGLIDVIFDVVDILKVQIAAVGAWVADPKDGAQVPQPPVADMIERLRGIVSGRVQTPAAREAGPGSATQRVGENLVDQGAVAPEAVDYALEAQKSEQHAGRKVGEILVDSGVATARQVSRAMRVQAQPGAAPAAAGEQQGVADQSIRIDTVKLDALVDMVGELVIAQTLVNANSQIAADVKLTKDVGQVAKIVREVQQVAMTMRMIPIGPTFRKMARLVRDVSRKAGKQVNLTIAGEETELDKTVIQQIGDPLVHMVRNAIDHGIELPEVRQAAGKPPMGEVHLAARHHGGNIVIEISDDGKDLDPEKLIKKGIEKGLVQPGEELTDQQAFALIFAAGFSTAEKVTDISGRGVGMDVVRRNIEQLRGRVDISSRKGQGSTFVIRLPLTLAIIDGMVVRINGERFILPTISIEQSLRPLREQITTVQHRGEVLKVRGQLVPLIQLGELFGLTGRMDPCEAMVVIAQTDEQRVGLVVEELIGQQQVVIKTLGKRFKQLRGICGAAILGDGKVGLILEVSGLAALHGSHVGSGRRDIRSEDPPPSADTAVEGQANDNAQEDHMAVASEPAEAASN